MKMEFIKMGINGEAIGYLDRVPVFCTGVLPGETAEIRILEDHRTYAKAEAVKLLTPSPDRIMPEGKTESECGFPLLCLAYPAQLKYKQQLLEEALWKYGHVNRKLVREIHGSAEPLATRSSCKLPFGMRRDVLSTGLYTPGTNHFQPIDHFTTHTPELEAARIAVLAILRRHGMQAFDPKRRSGLRMLVLRVIGGQAQCTLITGKETLPPELVSDLMTIPGMKTVAQSIRTERKGVQIFGSTTVLAGSPDIEISLLGIQLALAPESFFQLNVPQAEELYRMAVSKVDACNTLAEAYCGVGAMSLLAAGKAKEIIGFESIPEAVKNAAANAERNQIRNARFVCADAAEGLKKLLAEQKVDALLADPPRSGMDNAMLETILSSGIRKIIYISCDPATLGKNLGVLKQRYDIRTIIPFDLFPGTPHVESLTVLERIGGK